MLIENKMAMVTLLFLRNAGSISRRRGVYS